MVSLDLKIKESKVKSSKWKLAIEHTGKGLPTHIFEGKKSKKKSVEKEKELTTKQKQTSIQQEGGQKKIVEARKRKKGKKFKIQSETCTTETKAKARRKKKQESRSIVQSCQLNRNEQSQKSSDHLKRKQSGIPQKSNAVKAKKKKTKKTNKKQNPSPSKSEQGQNPTKTKQTGSPATAPENKKGKKHPLTEEPHAEEKTLSDTHSCKKKKQPPKKRKITEEAETQSNSAKDLPAKKRKTENVKKLGNSPQLSKPVTVKRINQTKPLKKTTLTKDLKLKGGVSKYEKAVGATALAVYSRRENEKQLLREAFAKNASK